MFHYIIEVAVPKKVPMELNAAIIAALPNTTFAVCSEIKLTKLAAIAFAKNYIGAILHNAPSVDYFDAVEMQSKPKYMSNENYDLLKLSVVKTIEANERVEFKDIPLTYIKADGMDLLKYMFLTSEPNSNFGNGDPLYFDVQFGQVGQEGSDADYNCMLSGSLHYDGDTGNFILGGWHDEPKYKAFKCIFKFPSVQVWLKALMEYIYSRKEFVNREFGIYPCDVKELLPCEANAEVIGFEISN